MSGHIPHCGLAAEVAGLESGGRGYGVKIYADPTSAGHLHQPSQRPPPAHPATQLEKSGNNRVRSQSSTHHLECPLCLQVSSILPPTPSAPAVWTLLPYLPATFSLQSLCTALSPKISSWFHLPRVALGSSSLADCDSWRRSLVYVTPISWLTQVGWAPMDPKALTLPFGALPSEGYPVDSCSTALGREATCFLPAWERPAVSALYEARASDGP